MPTTELNLPFVVRETDAVVELLDANDRTNLYQTRFQNLSEFPKRMGAVVKSISSDTSLSTEGKMKETVAKGRELVRRGEEEMKPLRDWATGVRDDFRQQAWSATRPKLDPAAAREIRETLMAEARALRVAPPSRRNRQRTELQRIEAEVYTGLNRAGRSLNAAESLMAVATADGDLSVLRAIEDGPALIRRILDVGDDVIEAARQAALPQIAPKLHRRLGAAETILADISHNVEFVLVDQIGKVTGQPAIAFRPEPREEAAAV